MSVTEQRGTALSVTAVVFDLDGVLVDSLAVMRAAFGHAYRTVVGPGEPPFDEYCDHLGWLFSDIMRAMGLPATMEVPFVAESSRLVADVPVYPGVARTLRRLAASGIATGVATGKVGHRARELLAVKGLLDHIDVVVGSDEVARPKPHPDIILAVLHRLGCRPDEALAVGDAVADIESARSAGVRVAAALWGQTLPAELLRAGPDLAISSPDELLTVCGLAT